MSTNNVLQRALDRLSAAQLEQLLESSEAATAKVREAEQLLLSSAEELRLFGIMGMAMSFLDADCKELFALTEERLLRERLLSQSEEEYNPAKEFEKAINKALTANAYHDAVGTAWSLLNYQSYDELIVTLRRWDEEKRGEWHHMRLAFEAAIDLLGSIAPQDQRAITAMTILWSGSQTLSVQARHDLQDLIHSHMPMLAEHDRQQVEKQLAKCKWLRSIKTPAKVATQAINNGDVEATITAVEEYLRNL